MPTKTIVKTRCTTCHRQGCDGGIWKRISATDKYFGYDIPIKDLHKHICSYHYGKSIFEKLRGKKVGDEVIIYFTEFTLKIKKVEE